jgi:hypothetical protein
MSDEPKNGLSFPQILAGALAAASAAIASSWLGVAGTVIGAAVVSVVASIGSVLYARPIERSQERLRAAASARSVGYRASASAAAAPTMLLPRVEHDLRRVRTTDPDGETSGAEAESASGQVADGDGNAGTRTWLARRWRTVAVSATAMLVGGLLILTGLELFVNGASSVTGVGGDRKPTIVRLFDDGGDRPSGGGGNSPEPADTDVSTPAEPRDSGTTPEPSEAPQSTEPAPADEPSQTPPTTAAPTERPTETEPTEPAPTSSAATTQPAPTATTR